MISFRFQSCKYTLEAGDVWAKEDKDASGHYYRDTAQNDILQIIEGIQKGSPWRDLVAQKYSETNPWLLDIVTSPKRDLYIRTYSLPENVTVLDIGAGWGQYSLPLAKTCEVTALEPTPERLAFIKAAADQEGVSDKIHFVEASFLDVDFETKFDCVLCIGVLEWVPAFSEGEPLQLQREFLQRIRNVLAENGKLILAIENRIGLKYVLGADDDHIGLPDIATYDAKLAAEKIRETTGRELRSFTYTRGELTGLLQQAGFTAHRFFGAFPDYKIPDKIIPLGREVDEHLLGEHSIIEHSGVNGRPLAFQRELASHYRTFATLGIASEFVPSFFVEADLQKEQATGEELKEVLIRHQIIDGERVVTFAGYPPRSHRRDRITKRAYRVISQNQTLFHLTVSTEDLTGLHERSKAFAEACPQLACKPLFYIHDEVTGWHLHAVEYFDGESLDEKVLLNSCEAGDWMTVAEKVHEELEKTAVAGCLEEMEAEFDELFDLAIKSLLPGTLDGVVLEQWIKPRIWEALSRLAPVKRWTNGDFHGGNILWDGVSRIRLVDYECARCTYFGELDWLFLLHFSKCPSNLGSGAFPQIDPALRPFWEALFWIKHWNMARQILPGFSFDAAAKTLLPKVVGILLTKTAERSILMQEWRNTLETPSSRSSNPKSKETTHSLNAEIERLNAELSKLNQEREALALQLEVVKSKNKLYQKRYRELKRKYAEFKGSVKKIKRQVTDWNNRSWFKRAFHRLRIQTSDAQRV